MRKKLKLTMAVVMASLFVLMGIFLLKDADASEASLLSKIIGIANIVFWGVMIIVVFYKTISNSIKK